MKGTQLQQRIFSVFKRLLWCTFLFYSIPLFADANSIFILQSNDNRFFNTTIDHIKENTKASDNLQISTLVKVKQNPQLLEQAQLIITLGYRAAEYLYESDIKTPVLSSYITQFEYQRIESKNNFHALLLEQPLERYIAFVKALMPIRSIAWIKNENNQLSKKTIKTLENKLDISIRQFIYHSNPNPVEIVRLLLTDNDVLISLPDSNIYNRQTLKGILLTSYRNQKPLISYSPAHVKSGALAAIFASPQNIGDQIAGLINQIYKSGDNPLKAVYFADSFNIVINEQVAKSLEIEIADKASILKTLQDKRPEK